MKILVTGGAGYVGSQLVKRLAEAGYGTVVYDNLSEGHRQAVDKNAVFIKGDLKDKVSLDFVFKKHKIAGIMHLAAYVSVAESVANPEKYYANNVECGANLLEAMKRNNVNFIVFSSSSIVYGAKATRPSSESDKTEPGNPYGETKLAFEKMLREADKAGIKSISLRYFNAAGADPSGCIGEDHRPETHLIPNVLKAAMGKSKEISIYGNDYQTKDGTAVRDYAHVMDLSDAHILALDALLNGHKTDIYNLGSEKGYSVLEVIRAAEEVTGRRIPTKIMEKRPGDVPFIISNSAKARKSLKWKPKYTDIKTIISTAWNWHKTHPDGFSE
ncbi:UDP-glucose 4-epimerase GalE [Candidatus Woesearchaeota archaeon]|nr:UDP-glucose 4-epimerase GalE [Candidatus Woesearchaeota archaeon]